MAPVYTEICHGTRPNLPLHKVGEIPQAIISHGLPRGLPLMNENAGHVGEYT
jgi:hypothetical protein